MHSTILELPWPLGYLRTSKGRGKWKGKRKEGGKEGGKKGGKEGERGEGEEKLRERGEVNYLQLNRVHQG